jgi:predicted Zn-dependent protease
MQKKFGAVVFAAAMVFAAAGSADAQEWRGMGRVGGKVVDESGKPIDGVKITATLPEAGNRGPAPIKSNSKGDWAVGGITGGRWALDFEKEGYETRHLAAPVSENSRLLPMEIVMKKAAPAAPDANEVIKAKLTEAAALMAASKFVEARAIYEELQKAHPEVKQFTPLIARAYYGEGNKEKAIELLRTAVAADPDNAEVKMLLGNLLMESGKAEEARALMSAVDESKVTDPVVFLNMGIGLFNDGKQAEAIVWFDKAIAKFPEKADAYYYRGLSQLGLGKQAEAKADLEKYVKLAPADAPELATAKKILETIK